MKRVVITGLGAITPIGNTVKTFWNSLINGQSGAKLITRFDTTKFKTKFACELKDYKAENYFDRSEIKKYDLFTQYALITVKEAVQNAAIQFDELNKNRIGVIWGSGNGGLNIFEQQVSEFARGDGTPRFNPFFIPKMIVNMPSGIISINYGLRGVNFSTVSACATSNTAIIDAFNYIRWGKADMIITGGSEAPILESSVGGFNASRALSTRNDTPEKASRPFDVTRDGFVMGEGAGAIILEEMEHAIKRGAPIIAEVAGGAMAADAYHLTSTHPDGEGAFLGMTQALEDASLTPADVDYVNAHATSTPLGDISELIAINRVFGTRPDLNISATKSMTGHLLGAAGVIEAIACIKAIETGVVPPTINTENVEPDFADKFNFTLGKAVTKPVNVAMSNTFGFGGHIATSVYKKFD